MKKLIKNNNIFTQYAPLLKYAYPLIASVIIALTLSPTHIKTAYDPNYQEAVHADVSDAAGAAATVKLIKAVREDNIDLALEAIHEKANVNIQSSEDYPPLTIASQHGHANIVHLLLEHRANVDIRASGGSTALILATLKAQDDYRQVIPSTLKGGTRIVHLLLKYQANVNIQGEDGHTALAWAVYSHNSTIIEALILHGANPNIVSKYKNTALSIASPEIRKIITDATAKKIALTQELGQQNWDLEISSPSHILEEFMAQALAFIVCDYANPYHPSKQCFHSIMKRCILDRKLAQTSKFAHTLSSTICCAASPDCNCSDKQRKKICNKCAIQ